MAESRIEDRQSGMADRIEQQRDRVLVEWQTERRWGWRVSSGDGGSGGGATGDRDRGDGN